MKHAHIILLGLLIIIWLTVVPTTFFIMVRPAAGLSNISLSLLSYGIFKRYFILSSLFSFVICAISFTTFICVFKHKINANLWCYLTSILLTAWMVAEVIFIGQLNWLHLVYFMIGILILLLTDMQKHYKLPY